MKSKSESSSNNDTKALAQDYEEKETVVEDEGGLQYSVIDVDDIDPDPNAQAGVNIPKVDREVEEPTGEEEDPASEGTDDSLGCTDPTASNYDEDATKDDGSCQDSSSEIPSPANP